MNRKQFTAVSIMILSMNCILPVSANSAATWAEGAETGGAVIFEDCPVEVIQEDLVFSLPDQPAVSANSVEGMPYRNTFEASYIFENPTGESQSVLLSFPVARSFYSRQAYGPKRPSEAKITVNDQETEVIHRYTYSPFEFHLQENLAKLIDGFMEDDFFEPAMDVWSYTFQAKTDQNDQPLRLKYEMDTENGKRRIRVPLSFTGASVEEDHVTVQLTLRPDEEFTVYIFGREPDEDPVFQNDSADAVLLSKSHMTYLEYVNESRPQDIGISESDWYNAVTQMHLTFGDGSNIVSENVDPDIDLLHWLQYTLDFKPHEQIKNTVKGTIWPDIDYSYEQPVYRYRYLLSPASSWASFRNLNVSVKSDMKMLSSSFTMERKAEGEYGCYLENLPEQELEFELCRDAHPKKKITYGERAAAGIMAAILIAGLPVFLIRKRTKGRAINKTNR